MKTKVWTTLTVLVAVAVSGCAVGPRSGAGAVGGAVAGGLIGAVASDGNPAATAAGVLVGLLAGAAIGDALDNQDRQLATHATSTALSGPAHRRYRWYNPRNQRYGYVIAAPPVAAHDGRYCREYQHTVLVAGREQVAYGKACQQPDGSWQVGG